MLSGQNQRLETCIAAAPTKETLMGIFRDFGPTGVIFGAIGPVAFFLKDITTSTTESLVANIANVKEKAHGVANTLSTLMAVSGILDAGIAIAQNYAARREAQQTKGESYKFTTSGKIALLLDAASAAVGVYSIQCSGTPGKELDTIAGAFASGAGAKIARVFHDKDTRAVQTGTAPLDFKLGQRQEAVPQPVPRPVPELQEVGQQQGQSQGHVFFASASAPPPGYGSVAAGVTGAAPISQEEGAYTSLGRGMGMKGAGQV